MNALSRVLPDYMVPRRYVIIDEWPLSLNGKVDRKALPEPVNDSRRYVAPVTEIEKALVKIWAGLLKTDAGNLSIHANFFELGGHSLLAVQLMADIRSQLSVELELRTLFSDPTIQGVASSIEQVVSLQSLRQKKISGKVISSGTL